MNDPCCNSARWGPAERGRPGKGTALIAPVSTPSILLFAHFLASAFSSKRSFHAFFFTRFQVKGVAFYLFNNVFLLHFALKTAQSVFEGFSLLQSNFRQTDTPPNPSRWTE